MHAVWISLKENVSCGTKLRDVLLLCRPEAGIKGKASRAEKEKPESKKIYPKCPVSYTHNYIRPHYYELSRGDPSRNVIEKIFRAALAKPLKHSRRIHNVYKVLNSMDNFERFEIYREMVKKRASFSYIKHPRSMVDGNELLTFYGTTILCYDREISRVSNICNYPACGVCRILESDFRTPYTKENGIRLSTCSEDLSESISTAVTKVKNVKRAAIVCRTIAGPVVDIINIINKKGCNSAESNGLSLHAKSKYLTLKKSNAVLPCFVIVFT